MATHTPSRHLVTLSNLPVGSPALIRGIDAAAPDHVARRLRHLGFRAGNHVQAVRVAPLGDPRIYRILGYDLCLRRQEADHVQVVVAS